MSKGPAQPVEKTITKSIALPEGEGTVKVRVVVGGSDVQFDSDVDRALMEISIPLTGSGTQIVSVYFDGTLSYNEEVTFS